MFEAEMNDLIENFEWNRVKEKWGLLSDLILRCRLKTHPFGFLHAFLVDDPHVALRLHIWDTTERHVQEPNWPIHSHVFDLRSIVLVGRLTNHSYHWSGGRLTATGRLYRTTFVGDTSRLEPTDDFGTCELVSSKEISSTDLYAVPFGDFHSSLVAEGSFAATLAVTVKGPGAPRIFGALEGEKSYSYQRHELTTRVQDRIVGELLERVAT